MGVDSTNIPPGRGNDKHGWHGWQSNEHMDYPPRSPSPVSEDDGLGPKSDSFPKVKDGFHANDKASVHLEPFKFYEGDEVQEFRPSCWSRFKVVVWTALAACVVGAVIAIAVIMTENGGGTDDGGAGVGVGVPPGAPPRAPGEGPAGNLTPEVIQEIEEQASDKDGTLKIMESPPFQAPPGYTALWWDEFDGDALDLRWWNYQYGYGAAEGLWQWGNREEQFYTDSTSNVRVSDGTLKITAIREQTVLPDGYTFNYTSGRINTRGKAGFYGGMRTADGRQWEQVRIEARIKAPQVRVWYHDMIRSRRNWLCTDGVDYRPLLEHDSPRQGPGLRTGCCPLTFGTACGHPRERLTFSR